MSFLYAQEITKDKSIMQNQKAQCRRDAVHCQPKRTEKALNFQLNVSQLFIRLPQVHYSCRMTAPKRCIFLFYILELS